MTTPQPKPLNQTERRALLSLVKNDYLRMLNELGANAQEYMAKRTTEINEKYADEGGRITEARQRVRELNEAFNRQWEALEGELRDQGITVSSNTRAQIQLPGLLVLTAREEELRQMKANANRAHSRASAQLREQQSKAERAVLLTAIVSDEAKAMLEAIPSASDVFIEALASFRPTEIES